jgi:diguanylate cyclase (GGDEF)-like protein/PAS domain S-box-containing protein
MRETADVDGYPDALARSALLRASILASAGSVLGIFAIQRGILVGFEEAVVLFGALFNLGLLVTLLLSRKAPVQMLAAASTVFYTLYLCAGTMGSVSGKGGNENLFVFLMWFFPLLVFNKLVNSPFVGRFLAKFLLIAPLLVLGCLFSRLTAGLSLESMFLVVMFCLSYVIFGLLLKAVTRYREACIVERERTESLRIESEVLESISDCFISLDSGFRLVYLNDAACTEFGVDRRAVLNSAIPDATPGFFSPSMLAELRAASCRASASMFEVQNEERGLWYGMRCYPRPGHMSVFFRNVTESILSRRKLDAANTRLLVQSELLDKAQDAIFVQDMDSRILYWNMGAERLFGWTSAEVMGRLVGDIFYQNRAEVQGAFSSVLKNGESTVELPKHHKDGKLLIVESRSTLLRDAGGDPQSILSINTDITGRKAAAARIHNLAFYDVLTGLPNRVLLRERMEGALATGCQRQNSGAVLLIDLDDFKTLNDTSGHHIGDLLLQEVALRLQACVRKSDCVARFGGDEFLVMLEGLNADAERAAAEAKAVGEVILQACRQPYILESYEYDGTTSIGIALFQGEQDTVDDLLKRADLAMYRAKAQGRDALCFFDPGMETSVASRAALLAELKRALQNGEFELHYQPQIDSSGRVTGAEALLRWPHAQRGMVPPSEFIPLAESAGLIGELGQWVLETACRQLAAWASQPGMEALTVAVNVSMRQFLDSRFVQLVERVLRESGANPRRLKLEITESFMMDKANETVAKMTAIRAFGVGFSMDDFGTGYSSLSQLKRLPLDQLKIDQSFVRDVLNSATDASIVNTIITLGRSLNLTVIAEGVETEQQRRLLEALGCYAYQGFLFSRALPSAGFAGFVEKTRWMKEEGAA